MKVMWAAAGLAFGGLLANAASSATFGGKIVGDDGKPVAGAMITLNDEKRGVAESAFSDAKGAFQITTALSGDLSLRIRKFYFADLSQPVTLSAESAIKGDFTLNRLKTAEAISDDLPAAYHLGAVPFEPGTAFSRDKFQADCLTCHQIGNAFTRAPHSLEEWIEISRRMGANVGNSDEAVIKKRAELLAAGFNGKPISVRPVFPYDAALARAKIFEYRLDKAVSPHDAAASPVENAVYMTDQSGDQMEVTDLKTGTTEYFPAPHEGLIQGGKLAQIRKRPGGGNYVGPHSLAFGQDGLWYVTDATSAQIGTFDPKTRSWGKSYDVPGNTLYPHTIRVDRTGLVWFTIILSNQIGRLDPATGHVTVIDVPKSPSNYLSGYTGPYGIAVNPKDGSVWYMKLFGDRIGRVDAKTFEVKEWPSPVEAPRRGNFDAAGTLWVSGFANGEIARIEPDGAKSIKSEVIKMPQFAKGDNPVPYSLNVDPKTGDVWVNDTMTDFTYRYIPGEKRWISYPMPLRGTFTRDITFTREGYACMSNNPSAANVSLEGGVTELICIHPEGDVKIEARAD